MMIMYFLTLLISNSVCKPLNYQIAGSDRPTSALDFFRPISANEMQANWDQATFSSNDVLFISRLLHEEDLKIILTEIGHVTENTYTELKMAQ